MSNTTYEMERINTKVNGYLSRTYALHLLIGGDLTAWSDSIHPDGRKRKPIIRQLVADGKIAQHTGASASDTNYITSKVYDTVSATKPDMTAMYAHDWGLHPFTLRKMPITNLKYIIEHRDEYLVGYVHSLDTAVAGEVFEISDKVGQTDYEARSAYVDAHNTNTFDLAPVAFEKAFIGHKAEEAREELICETMASNLVEHLIDGGYITKDEAEHVGVSSGDSRKRHLPVIFAEDTKGLSGAAFNWRQDIEDVVGQCKERIDGLKAKLAVYEKLQGLDWSKVRLDLRKDCTQAVGEYLAKDE